jgi:hypothetical protein
MVQQQTTMILGGVGVVVVVIIILYFMFFSGGGSGNCLTIGEHQLCSDGPSLVITRQGHPKKIILWTGGDHSSMMTQRTNNTDHWFGY